MGEVWHSHHWNAAIGQDQHHVGTHLLPSSEESGGKGGRERSHIKVSNVDEEHGGDEQRQLWLLWMRWAGCQTMASHIDITCDVTTCIKREPNNDFIKILSCSVIEIVCTLYSMWSYHKKIILRCPTHDDVIQWHHTMTSHGDHEMANGDIKLMT